MIPDPSKFSESSTKIVGVGVLGGVTVTIELALQTFYDINENSGSFTADVLMRYFHIFARNSAKISLLIIFYHYSQIWHDERLKYAQFTECVENLTLSSAITDSLW